jgi:hypothetical protein
MRLLLRLSLLAGLVLAAPPAHVHVHHFDEISFGGGGSVAQIVKHLRDGDVDTVCILDRKNQLGGAVNSWNELDFGVAAYLNTSAYVPLGYNLTFNAEDGGFLGWVESWVGEENIQAFGPLGFEGPYITADPNLGGSIQFVTNSGNLTEADVLWLYDNITASFPELVYQPGYPRNLSAVLRQSVRSWLLSDPAYAKFIPLVADACRSGGFDVDSTPVYLLLEELPMYLLPYLSGGYLFRVKLGNQFYYDQMADFVQSSNGSGVFFGAEVTKIVLSPAPGGHGSVAVLFTTPDGKHHVAHAPRLLWTVPPTPENWAIVENLPSEVLDAFAGVTLLPYFYAQRFHELSNPWGIPVLSITNEADSVEQAAKQGVVFLYETSAAGVWGGMSWTNVATDGPAEVTARTHVNLTQLANMTLFPGVPLGLVLALDEQWWHESYGVKWNTSAIQADTYAAVEDVVCIYDGLVTVIGGTVGHWDTALLNNQADRTMRRCGPGLSRRRNLHALAPAPAPVELSSEQAAWLAAQLAKVPRYNLGG